MSQLAHPADAGPSNQHYDGRAFTTGPPPPNSALPLIPSSTRYVILFPRLTLLHVVSRFAPPISPSECGVEIVFGRTWISLQHYRNPCRFKTLGIGEILETGCKGNSQEAENRTDETKSNLRSQPTPDKPPPADLPPRFFCCLHCRVTVR